jgi:hypothetical protein
MGLTKEQKIINQLAGSQIQKQTPIATDMYLPNYSVVNDAKVRIDHNVADTPYIPMVLFGTDATPPTASTVPIGTIYLQYTP